MGSLTCLRAHLKNIQKHLIFHFLKNSKKCLRKVFRNQVTSWFQINIPFELKEHNFTKVPNKLNKQNDKEKIIVHTSCHDV